MKCFPKILALLLLILANSADCIAANTIISLEDVRKAGLRVVEVNTIGGEEPMGEVIVSPFDADNHNYTYTNIVPCQIVITLGGDTLYDSGEYEKDRSGATIRINGNTSAYYSNPLNMPYKLKLEKKADLLSRNDAVHYADKHWRLLKDALSLNTIIGLKVSRLMEMEWTSSFTPCNLIINGDYRGCYLLMETTKRNPDCRINTDKEQGYIVERDPYWWKEHRCFVTHWFEKANTYRWTWKYPDEDDVTENKERYISEYINAAEQSIVNGNYEKFIDIDSFAKWLLAHDILGTYDSGGSNMFIKKYDETDNTPLEMPCLWDFDSNFKMQAGNFSRLHTSTNAYFSTLMGSSNDAFARKYISLWNEKKEILKEQIISYINDYCFSDEGAALNVSRELNGKRWNKSHISVEQNAAIAINWFNTHIELLDKQIQQINITAHIKPAEIQKSEQYYDIRGILIRNPFESKTTVRSIINRTKRKIVVF